MKRSISLILTAAMLSVIPSCGLLNSAVQLPTSLLQSVGRTAGIGLTDTKPQPVQSEEIKETE